MTCNQIPYRLPRMSGYDTYYWSKVCASKVFLNINLTKAHRLPLLAGMRQQSLFPLSRAEVSALFALLLFAPPPDAVGRQRQLGPG